MCALRFPHHFQTQAGEMTETDRVQENRVRRMADRQGFALSKNRRRDPLARDYGEIYILDEHGTRIGTFKSLDDAEAWLKNPERRR
jgi:hypothetical protein